MSGSRICYRCIHFGTLIVLSYRHLKNSKCSERLSLNFPFLPKDRVSERSSTLQNLLPGSFIKKERLTPITSESKVNMLVAQLCPTLYELMDYTIHGILQARILEWVAIPFSRGSSGPRDYIQVFCVAGGFFTIELPGDEIK